MGWFNKSKKKTEDLDLEGYAPTGDALTDYRSFLIPFLKESSWVDSVKVESDHIEVLGRSGDFYFVSRISTQRIDKDMVSTNSISFNIGSEKFDGVFKRINPGVELPVYFFMFELGELEKFGLGKYRGQVGENFTVVRISDIPKIASRVIRYWLKHSDYLISHFTNEENVVKYLESAAFKDALVGCRGLRNVAMVHTLFTAIKGGDWKAILQKYQAELDRTDSGWYEKMWARYNGGL